MTLKTFIASGRPVFRSTLTATASVAIARFDDNPLVDILLEVRSEKGRRRPSLDRFASLRLGQVRRLLQGATSHLAEEVPPTSNLYAWASEGLPDEYDGWIFALREALERLVILVDDFDPTLGTD